MTKLKFESGSNQPDDHMSTEANDLTPFNPCWSNMCHHLILCFYVCFDGLNHLPELNISSQDKKKEKEKAAVQELSVLVQ